MIANSDAGPAPLSRLTFAAAGRAWPWLVLAGLLGIAVLVRHVVAANTDVSWLITAGERVLGGQRLYVDIIETNPPMAVLAYLPGIALARATGIAAGTAVDALVFTGILMSLALCARFLMRTEAMKPGESWPLALLALAVLAILPAQSFGQREHIAVIALLPLLAAMVVRAGPGRLPLAEATAAGLGAAVALSFKPHFALPLLAALAVPVVALRSLRVLLAVEVVTVGVAMLVYAALVLALCPEFFTVIAPLVRDVYLPVHQSWPALLAKPAVWLWVIAMLATLALTRLRPDTPLMVLMAASSGFAVVFLLQRKGWPYHSYPALALALLGLGRTLTARADRALRVGGVIVLAALFARAMLWFDAAFDARPLQERVAQLGLSHPAVLAISAEPGIGHPLVRALGGTWVSRQQALWVAAYLDVMRHHGPVAPGLETYAARERAMLIEDTRRMPPDVVLVDDLTGQASALLQAHPELGSVLSQFRRVDSINDVGIWLRKR